MNTKELILALANDVNYLTQKDIAHMPAGKEADGCGGCSRGSLAIMSESAAFNNTATKLLSDSYQEGYFEEQMGSLKASNKEEAAKQLDDSFNGLKAQIEAMSEEDLAAQCTAPWGEPMPKAKLAAFAVAHTFYHDGQLNYIQTIHGDDAVHWME